MTDHKIGTREEWLAAREQLLVREKEHTRLGDEIAQQRRELPWVPVDKEYRFDTDDGEKMLAELFDGRSQLLVYHFMFGPSYEAGCPTCSSVADGINGVLPHLHARDVTLVLVSQAPLEKLQTFRRRMGWRIPWVSSAGTDFNLDLGFSSTEEQTREWVAPMLDQLPPIADRNATETGTDVVGYLARARASAPSPWTTGPCTTPIRPGLAGSSSCWATTQSSTAHRRAVTRATRSRSGSAGTTSTVETPPQPGSGVRILLKMKLADSTRADDHGGDEGI